MTQTSPKPKRQWLKPVLVISLACNLLIVGIVAGFVMSNRGDMDRRDRVDGPARSLVGIPFIRALEPEDRRRLNDRIERDGARLRENRAELRARFETLLTALTAEPFDPDAVQSIFREQRSIALNRQNIGEALLIEQLTQMSASEREDYAKRLARDLRRLRQK